jgi:hypothetical protein
MVGPLVPIKWQLFTNEKEPVGPLVDALVPNEITLTQLVAGPIAPEFEGRFDFNTAFKWNLEEGQTQPKKGEKVDLTQRILIPIPTQIPENFILGVLASSVHKEMKGRRSAQLGYQAAQVYLTFREGAKVSDVNTGIAELMAERGLGD